MPGKLFMARYCVLHSLDSLGGIGQGGCKFKPYGPPTQ